MYDMPEWQIRARNVGSIAYKMRDCKTDLELRLGPKEIRLCEDPDSQNEIYSTKMVSNHTFGNKEKTKAIEDVKEAGKREGYMPSLLDRALLRMGYIPSTVNFSRVA